ncbi:hypothetical protein K1T71_013972 [Dendrolimus kikuchii]|uniref:Uncharacterized protein n=1 Tax=Dendrolimus kikuchii TaxID=765133 RepID=A0ACC1CGI1_9NEOP|nr:hypothetical protein K1T71_013972 [Dendrolimus kikuchii]
MDFTNKVVIVTGASSGIGAASALLFAKYGAKLTLIGRDKERLNNITEKCFNARGIKPVALRLDLTEAGSCEAVITKTIAAFNKIDVLVNCAGKFTLGSLFDDNIEAFDDMMSINLRVPYKLIQLAVPYLAKTKGNVVNLTTTKFTRVRHGFMAYSIAKSGLEKMTRIAAIELASEGIRVNAVQPGLTRTNILSNLAMSEEERKGTYERISCNLKVIEPEEVAKMVLFVASEVCPNLNGADMALDGATSFM